MKFCDKLPDLTEVVGLLVAVAALLVSVHANRISTKNEARLERAECMDRLDTVSGRFLKEYKGILPIASYVYNNRENTSLVSRMQQTLLERASALREEIRQFNKITRRYSAKCSPAVSQLLKSGKALSEPVVDITSFPWQRFEPEAIENHLQSLNSAETKDIIEECCDGAIK